MQDAPGETVFDVLIVGAGPVGLACGIAAKRRGYRYAVLEKGCLVHSIYRFPRNMGFFTKTFQARLDPDTRESRDVPGIFLAGGVAAGLEAGSVFIENGRYDCELIFKKIGEITG